MTTSNLMPLLIASQPDERAGRRPINAKVAEFGARQRPVSERKQFDEGRARLRNLKSEYTFCLNRATTLIHSGADLGHNSIEPVGPFMVMLCANIIGRAISSAGPPEDGSYCARSRTGSFIASQSGQTRRGRPTTSGRLRLVCVALSINLGAI